jgi:hypothetical protein
VSDYIHAKISPPKRVEILKVEDARVIAHHSSYWKPGQFGYAIAYSTHPGMHTMDSGPSKAHELTYLVSKAAHGRGGALWFSADALRFTPRKVMIDREKLSNDEKVALDLLLERGNGSSKQLSMLVPDEARRTQIKALASQLRSLRTR